MRIVPHPVQFSSTALPRFGNNTENDTTSSKEKSDTYTSSLMTAIYLAKGNDNLGELANLLGGMRVDKDKKDKQLEYLETLYGEKADVRYDLKQRDLAGYTLLERAIERSHGDLAEMLLERFKVEPARDSRILRKLLTEFEKNQNGSFFLKFPSDIVLPLVQKYPKQFGFVGDKEQDSKILFDIFNFMKGTSTTFPKNTDYYKTHVKAILGTLHELGVDLQAEDFENRNVADSIVREHNHYLERTGDKPYEILTLLDWLKTELGVEPSREKLAVKQKKTVFTTVKNFLIYFKEGMSYSSAQ